MLAFSLIAQQDMKKIFINMPDSLSPLFTKVNRADFADFLESNMKAQVKNKFDKVSEMKVLTDNYLFLETTSQSSLEIKLLPVNDSTGVLCVVKTVCGMACDSDIRFFDTSWKELPDTGFLKKPSSEQFIQVTDTTDMEKLASARGMAAMTLIKAKLSPVDNTLTFIYTTPDYMDKESAEEMKAFLRKDSAIVYQWEHGRFEL